MNALDSVNRQTSCCKIFDYKQLSTLSLVALSVLGLVVAVGVSTAGFYLGHRSISTALISGGITLGIEIALVTALIIKRITMQKSNSLDNTPPPINGIKDYLNLLGYPNAIVRRETIDDAEADENSGDGVYNRRLQLTIQLDDRNQPIIVSLPYKYSSVASPIIALPSDEMFIPLIRLAIQKKTQ